ncbi:MULTISPECIES: GNAT family N-acetyltransferase [unclassified Brevundimonas]|uniref:GNAT family N-acetyltransferase n=1 Tax=unclassified Brevundimonas TaxID=2622653 RepID=UPI0025BEC18D|nr:MULTISPECIES: GNAT family N-acetyltransferase [unclassified Brevundimonas]
MTNLSPIRDNQNEHRYELEIDGQLAYVEYNNVAGGRLVSKTLVPKELEGQGIASRLARHVLQDIRDKGLKILPTCTFFAAYIQKHPDEYRDLVQDGYKAVLGL